MKREELIQLLEESAANNLAVARQLEERAGYFDHVGKAADADCVRKVAARARFSADPDGRIAFNCKLGGFFVAPGGICNNHQPAGIASLPASPELPT